MRRGSHGDARPVRAGPDAGAVRRGAIRSRGVGRAIGTRAGRRPAVLVGRTFLSTGADGHQLVPDSQVRLVFLDDARLGVSAGCNSMGGGYTISDSTLHISGPDVPDRDGL